MVPASKPGILMRFGPFLLAGVCVAGLSPAAALAYTGDVSVNPVAGTSGVVLYPGGQYMRVLHPLAQPGETAKDDGTIRLHMPSKASARRAVVARSEAAPAPEAAPEPKPASKPAPARQVAKAAPPPPAAPVPPPPASDYSPFRPQPTGPSAAPAPKPAEAPKPAPKQQIARAEPPPARTTPSAPAEAPLTPGLTKRSVILFAPDATDPAKSALGAIKYLAEDLTKATSGPGSRVQLQAYGGTRGDKGSDARRLSLKRALSIRQVLIDDGVPAERIDVHAEGGVDDSGPADRVDVYIKA